MNFRSIFFVFFCFVFLILGCATNPAEIGMSKMVLLAKDDQPDKILIGSQGIEFLKYGSNFAILQNDKVVRAGHSGRDFSNLIIGLPEEAIPFILGKPHSMASIKEVTYFNYVIKPKYYRGKLHFVRVVRGVVDSFGIQGDFGTTLPEEKTINVNVDDKRRDRDGGIQPATNVNP